MNKTDYTYKGADLRTVNVTDLTDDQTYLSKFLAPELGISSMTDYLSMSINSESRIFDLFDYAEHFQITELVNKLEKLYKKELISFFNE